MLRWLAIALIAANLLYYAGTHGHLAGLGWPAATAQREPGRLAQQIEPQRLRLLNGARGSEPEPAPTAPRAGNVAAAPASPAPAAPAAPVAAAPEPAAPVPEAPPTCWQASGFGPEQAELLRAELRLLGLADSAWQLAEVRSPGRWIVYMGRYDNAEQAARKKAELRELGIDHRDVNTQGLAPGIALGTFSSEESANDGLAIAVRRGVRTARVVQERAESLSYNLRLPAITEARRQRIESLGPAMAGRTLQRCS